jgi:hypothetical protein
VLQGNICALLAAKDHVNVFLYDGGIVPDPDGIITAGHDNKTARTVAIRQGEAINAPALSAMFRHIIANNRAGGWRKLKRERLLATGAAKDTLSCRCQCARVGRPPCYFSRGGPCQTR